LNPEWEKLAGAVKGTIKVAYWDTEHSGRPPRLLGEIQGTPTIRLFQPKRKQSKPLSFAQKVVTDYQYERAAKDMKRWIDGQMFHYVEMVTNGKTEFEKYKGKADKHGLPKAILFASKATVSSLTKFLSVEFRRRLLLAQVQPTKKNEEIMKEHGVDSNQLPALVVIPPEGEPIVYDGEQGFQKNKLHRFLSVHALKNPVISQTKQETADGSSPPLEEEEKKRKVKVEL